ncbi:TonB-dependent receptor plug domain-containing protein [Candidatus Auribacterota bacterium]
MKNKKRIIIAWYILLILIIAFLTRPAIARKFTVDDLMNMSPEELLEVPVTSVAGVEKSLSSTPAAMFVVTQNDIKRSGHRHIAEILRIVPGMNVGQLSSNAWSISSRGFSVRFADKLLVLLDGRILYNHIFSGVLWDSHNIVLEDIDRIEVIRGPGATLWGANAVNGVINIETKNSIDTQGLLLDTGVGTKDKAFCDLRYGAKLADNVYGRIYLKCFDRDSTVDPAGNNIGDVWNMLQGGFRIDMEKDVFYKFTLQGDIYDSNKIKNKTFHFSQAAGPPTYRVESISNEPINGFNLMGKVSRTISDTAGWNVKIYYEKLIRKTDVFYEAELDFYDLDFRNHFQLGEKNAFMWGLGYHNSMDDMKQTIPLSLSYNPPAVSWETFSTFLQDTINFTDDFFVMLGSKFEENDTTGFEYQPNIRMSWNLHPKQTLWASAARTVRSPARNDKDLTFPLLYIPTAAGPLPINLVGNKNTKSEILYSYELGWRFSATEKLSLDLAAYLNEYKNLLANKFISSTVMSAYPIEGTTKGCEILANLQATEDWRLFASYGYYTIDRDVPQNENVQDFPQNQFTLRSYLNLTDDIEVNGAIYYVGKNEAQNSDKYVRLDLGMTYRPTNNIELQIWGQNLLDSQHYECWDEFFLAGRQEIERAYYAKMTIRY